VEKVRRLQQLMGIGLGSSWVFVMELFSWREFQNRRQVAGAVGLTQRPITVERVSANKGSADPGTAESGNC